MKCVNCGGEFKPRKKAKTCSPECSKAHRAKRECQYRKDHAMLRRIKLRQDRARSVCAVYRPNRKIERAVRLLFALTGEKTL